MEWIEIVTNPKAILKLYDPPPPLTQIDLLAIHHRIARAEMEITIEFHLFPDHPSERWRKNYNKAMSLSFTLEGVRSLISHLKGPDHIIGVNLQMTKDSDICRVVIEGHSDTLLECEAEYITISTMQSYYLREIGPAIRDKDYSSP